MVLPTLDQEMDVEAKRLDRSKSWLVEKIIQRGLAAYRRDGLLAEPEPAQAQHQKLVMPDGRVLEGPFTVEINGIKFDRLSDELLQELSKTLPLKEA